MSASMDSLILLKLVSGRTSVTLFPFPLMEPNRCLLHAVKAVNSKANGRIIFKDFINALICCYVFRTIQKTFPPIGIRKKYFFRYAFLPIMGESDRYINDKGRKILR